MIDCPQGQKLNYESTQINYIGIDHHKQYSLKLTEMDYSF